MYFSSQLHTNKIHCYWGHSGQSNSDKFYIWAKARDAEVARRGLDVLMQSSKMSSILVTCAITEDSRKKIQEIESKPMYSRKSLLIGNELGSEDITVVATSDIFKAFEKEIYSIISQTYDSGFLNVRLEKFHYMQRYMVGKLQELERKYNVNINMKKPPTILVIGKNEHSNSIRTCIGEIKQICVNSIDISGVKVPDLILADKLKMETGIQMLKSVEEKHQCYINQTDATARQICTYSWLASDFHVVVVNGRTNDLVVDAVVVPVNECLFPVGYSDEIFKGDADFTGPAKKNMEKPKKYSIGDIFHFTAEPHYSFHTALLTVFTTQNQLLIPGNIFTAVQKVLNHCQKEGIQSVAIPMQVAENFAFAEQVQEVLKALNSSFSVDNDSSLQEIYLCVLDEQEITDVVKIIRENLTPGLHYFDWTPMESSSNDIEEKCPIEVQIEIGSLVDQQVNMLVNTVGIDLNLKNGFVSKSILERAGQDIQDFCNKKYPKGIKYGEVIETPAGNIKNCISICHGALTEWYHRTDLSLQVLRLVIWQCLIVADKNQFRTVAMPAFGTGKLCYPSRKVAETMFDIVYRFGIQFPFTYIRSVQIVLPSKDAGNIAIFETVQQKWKTKKQSMSAGNKEVEVQQKILECTVPAEYGNVCVQVLPLKGNTPDEDLTVYFESSYQKESKLKRRKSGNIFMESSPYPYFDSSLTNILILVEQHRISELALVFKEKTPEHVDKLLKTVQDVIFKDTSDRGYLETVKIYLGDEGQFNEVSTKLPKCEENSGFVEYFKKKKGIKRYKGSTAWVKTIPRNQRGNLLITVAGKQDKSFEAEKEIVDFLAQAKKDLSLQVQQPNKKMFQKWEVKEVQSSGIKYAPLPDEVCRAIQFSIDAGHRTTEYPQPQGIWIYDFTEGVCYSKNNPQDQRELLKVKEFFNHHDKPIPDEGSSVDPVGRSKSKWEDQDIFECIQAVVDCRELITRNYQSIEDTFEKLKLLYIKMETGKWKVKCESLDELETLNSILKEKHGLNSLISYTQKQPGDGAIAMSQTERKPDVNRKKSIDFILTKIEFNLMLFFCKDSQIFFGKYEYKNGRLTRTLVPGENESDLQIVFETKIQYIRSLSSSEVLCPYCISDEKFHQIERDISESGEIYCNRSPEKKMLILYSSNYEKLGEGKHKAELLLGMKQQSKGRRQRVFKTDVDLDSATPKATPEVSIAQSHKRSDVHSRSFSASSGPVMEQTFKTSEGIIVKVYIGNILKLNVDGIVNAANETLSHGGGVAQVIAEAAGYDFEKESDDYIKANGQIQVGSCCSTSAGRLHYKYVIHTVGPKWYCYNDKKQCCDVLKKAVENCFYEAELNRMSSIATPSISAGIFGVPKEVCVAEYCNAVEDFSRKNGSITCLKEIHFVDKDASMIMLIQSQFSQKFVQVTSASTSMAGVVALNSNNTGSGTRTDEFANPAKVQRIEANFNLSTNKYQKQFAASKDVKIIVVHDDIVKMKVSTIICPQDESCSNKGAVAQAINVVSDAVYRQEVAKHKWISKCEIRKTKASPPSLPFQYVLQTVPPRYDRFADSSKTSFEIDLERTISNIIRHCHEKTDVSSVAMPILGIGKDGFQTPVALFAKNFVKVILKEMKFSLRVKEIYIVTNDVAAASIVAEEIGKEKSFTPLTSFSRSRSRGNKGNGKHTLEEAKTSVIGKSFRGTPPKDGHDNCVICMDQPTNPRALNCGHVFCEDCIKDCFKVKPVCPTCGSIEGIITGDQPPGKMSRFDASYSLPGYSGCGTIEIDYEIYPGTQGKEHPDPGQKYKGIKRTAFLPNNKKGKLIADLLKIAFDRKLVFTIGHSRTTGEQGVVTWNDIHHKTSSTRNHQFGYPDEGYFDRVLDELKIKGVTEKDLKKM